MVLDKHIAELDPQYFWLGGGRWSLKLGISIDDFKKYTGDKL